MRAVNLHFLTRTHDPLGVSLLLEELSGRADSKEVSAHETATLCSFADSLSECLSVDGTGSSDDWIFFLDGFYFSYTIEHIGKEFDLLKVSADGGCILNIELKSEQVEEEKIRKQLEQNRYYLSHIAHTILSFTYVMETDRLYCLTGKGVFCQCGMKDVADALRMEALKNYLPEGIEKCFRAAEYLISPIADPEKFLRGKYFLTNQQFDFRRRILSCLQNEREEEKAPVISVSGIAGTGKTLLLLDVAVCLSEKKHVLFIHSGPLRKGHIEIDRRLKRIDIISAAKGLSENSLAGYSYVAVDEADYLNPDVLEKLLTSADSLGIPVILTYDPHKLLSEAEESRKENTEVMSAVERIGKSSTLSLSFTGHIRINRPVFSFLRSVLNLKDITAGMDYGCIDVLYAEDEREQDVIECYFRRSGYVLVRASGGDEREDDVIAREYDRVMMVLDKTYYYDDDSRLRVLENEEESLRLLYEGLSRTRENLCLLISGNWKLFLRILEIRLNDGANERLQRIVTS